MLLATAKADDVTLSASSCVKRQGGAKPLCVSALARGDRIISAPDQVA